MSQVVAFWFIISMLSCTLSSESLAMSLSRTNAMSIAEIGDLIVAILEERAKEHQERGWAVSGIFDEVCRRRGTRSVWRKDFNEAIEAKVKSRAITHANGRLRLRASAK